MLATTRPDHWLQSPSELRFAMLEVATALTRDTRSALTQASGLAIPAMAAGQTAKRFQILAEVAAVDLSLGRVYEGHVDCLDILRDAGLEPRPGLYAVWAAYEQELLAMGAADAIELHGRKPYCSGASFVDFALVAAVEGDHHQLFEIDARAAGQSDHDSWPSVGMAGSDSQTITYSGDVPLRRIGGPGFYLSRPGFWQGSLNVTACWYGGALGLARGAMEAFRRRPDDYKLGFIGELTAEMDGMAIGLNVAADSIDADPGDSSGRAHERALLVRQQVYSAANRVLDLCGRIGGTDSVTHDAAQSRRFADLPVYLRQFRPGLETAQLGRMVVDFTNE